MNCPKCHRELVIKDGQYGRFLACPAFPECRYTKSFSSLKNPYCEKCKSTGLLPLRRKSDNSIVPFAWTYCECHKDESYGCRERVHAVSPEDFDFAMSYDYHRSLCQEHGWHDPGSCELPSEPSPVEKVRFTHVIDRVRVLRPNEATRLRYLEIKFNEHLDKSLPPRKQVDKAAKGFTL